MDSWMLGCILVFMMILVFSDSEASTSEFRYPSVLSHQCLWDDVLQWMTLFLFVSASHPSCAFFSSFSSTSSLALPSSCDLVLVQLWWCCSCCLSSSPFPSLHLIVNSIVTFLVVGSSLHLIIFLCEYALLTKLQRLYPHRFCYNAQFCWCGSDWSQSSGYSDKRCCDCKLARTAVVSPQRLHSENSLECCLHSLMKTCVSFSHSMSWSSCRVLGL